MCWSSSFSTTTRWRRPKGRVISITSPSFSSLWGLALCPLMDTLPPLQAFWASERVLKRHDTSSQTSRRTAFTTTAYKGKGQRAEGKGRAKGKGKREGKG